jgi:hypothetical protein
MKAYGLPRDDDVENPDVADIKLYGLKTSIGGRDYFKNKQAKRNTRRIYKKKERIRAKLIIKQELDNV